MKLTPQELGWNEAVQSAAFTSTSTPALEPCVCGQPARMRHLSEGRSEVDCSGLCWMSPPVRGATSVATEWNRVMRAMRVADALLRWVADERFAHTSATSGGMTCGDFPRVVPSVLAELERIVRPYAEACGAALKEQEHE